MSKKHYLVYKTTCLINGKIYIGQHQTYDQNDNYLGSGRDLKEDIRKFGSENFKREILFDFETQKEMDDKEKELVTEEFVKREDTYNVRVGGQNPELSDVCKLGGLKVANLCQMNETFSEKLSQKKRLGMKLLWKFHPERFKNCCALNPKYRATFSGKHHSDETKKKISEKNKRMVGELNSCWGTVWIYNENLEQNKKVKKEEAETFLKQGWKLGRRMNFHK